MEEQPKPYCRPCAMKGASRPATVEYAGEKYCETCERGWVAAQRRVDHVLDEVMPSLLRRAIKARGLRFREVAMKAGVTEVAFGRYVKESGEPARPSLETFVRICVAVGCHPNELLNFEDPRLKVAERERARYGAAINGMAEIFRGLEINLGDKVSTGMASYGTRAEREERARGAYDEKSDY